MRAVIGPLVIIGLLVAAWMFFMRTPGGISEAQYAQFKQLAAPKLLYSCTRKPTQAYLIQQTRKCAASGRAGCEQESYDSAEKGTQTIVEFAGGTGSTTYEEVMRQAKVNCEKNQDNLGDGNFKVLEAVRQ